nr:hypothetical protein [Tanacetum cinerariifolium]
KLQQEEREEYTIKERAKFLAKTIAAQRRFRAAQRSAKIRSIPPTKSQLRNLMMTYLKNIGGYKHSQLKAKTFTEIQVDKEKVLEEPDSTKAEVKQERDEESIKKRPGRRLKMKAKRKCIYHRIFRSDGSSRWIKTFSEMVTQFDMMDIEELYNLVMQRFETTFPEDGIEIYMLAERRYPLIKETLERMLALRLIAEYKSKVVFDLLRFVQKQIDKSRSHDGSEKDLKELASPKQTNLEQTVTGKETSNLFMAGSLPNTT